MDFGLLNAISRFFLRACLPVFFSFRFSEKHDFSCKKPTDKYKLSYPCKIRSLLRCRPSWIQVVKSVKSRHQYFCFFGKKVVNIMSIELGLVSNESLVNSTYYRGNLKFLNPSIFWKITVFLKFYAVITISQKILWNCNYSIKTVIFSKMYGFKILWSKTLQLSYFFLKK